MKVVKFGGTSLADWNSVQQAINILAAGTGGTAVVCSAPGKRFSTDVKVTDLLIQLASSSGTAALELEERLLLRYQALFEQGVLPQHLSAALRSSLRHSATNSYDSLQARLDTYKSLGEEFSARCLTSILQAKGYNTKFCDPAVIGLILEGDFSGGRIATAAYRNISSLSSLIYSEDFLVFPGFYGINQAGQRITMSRGGSDVSATFLAAALRADSCHIYSDVCGVLEADPTLIRKAKQLAVITYDEMLTLALKGAQVLHPEALAPFAASNFKLELANTFRAEVSPTVVTKQCLERKSPLALSHRAKTPTTVELSLIAQNLGVNTELGRQIMASLAERNFSATLVQTANNGHCFSFELPLEQFSSAHTFLWSQWLDSYQH